MKCRWATSLFPGAPLDAHGLTIPLVIGTALGVAPTLVSSTAQGTLATPLPATAVETVNLAETGANFPAAGAILVGGETITYSGRRVGLLLDGGAALQLLAPVRNAPVTHNAGEAVALAPPIVYRYLIGLGLTPLELLAVRDAAASSPRIRSCRTRQAVPRARRRSNCPRRTRMSRWMCR